MSSNKYTSQHQCLLDKAAALFMRFGVRNVSMDDLARELGMSKKTIYQQIDNKEQLIKEVIDHRLLSVMQEMQAVGEASKDAIHEMLLIARMSIRYMRELSPATLHDLKKYHADLYQKIVKFQQHDFYEVVRKNLQRGIDQGLYRDILHVDIIARLFTGKTILVADDQMFSLREYDTKVLVTEYLTYHLYGVCTPLGLEMLARHRSEYNF